MKKKANRLDAIKMIISSKDVSSQEELLQALSKEGFELTQATLSRDLKQLKVAKAANMNGKYVYVLPNNIMYKRSNDQSASEMLMTSGFVSLQFSVYYINIYQRHTETISNNVKEQTRLQQREQKQHIQYADRKSVV